MLADLFDPAFADSIARIAVPILLASLGGAICHRAGVFNIALEGFILMGAFAAVLGSFMLGHVFWGVLCAILAGIFMGLLFAEFHIYSCVNVESSRIEEQLREEQLHIAMK